MQRQNSEFNNWFPFQFINKFELNWPQDIKVFCFCFFLIAIQRNSIGNAFWEKKCSLFQPTPSNQPTPISQATPTNQPTFIVFFNN